MFVIFALLSSLLCTVGAVCSDLGSRCSCTSAADGVCVGPFGDFAFVNGVGTCVTQTFCDITQFPATVQLTIDGACLVNGQLTKRHVEGGVEPLVKRQAATKLALVSMKIDYRRDSKNGHSSSSSSDSESVSRCGPRIVLKVDGHAFTKTTTSCLLTTHH